MIDKIVLEIRERSCSCSSSSFTICSDWARKPLDNVQRNITDTLMGINNLHVNIFLSCEDFTFVAPFQSGEVLSF